MSSFNPSAPPMPDSSASYTATPNYPPPAQAYHVSHHSFSSSSGPPPPSTSAAYGGAGDYSHSYNSNYPPPPAQSYHVGHQYHGGGGFSSGYNPFPPGTDPEVIRAFQMVDMDRSGFVDDCELQRALSSAYHRFSLRTIRLLIFLYKKPNEKSLRLGPSEFAALWKCLGEWRVIFERFDRDRSGLIDPMEIKDALYSLGYAVPPSVLQVLLARYDSGSKTKFELDFDSFVECGMLIKGLTERFKEKDQGYTGSATFSYDSFMTMVLPFLVTYD